MHDDGPLLACALPHPLRASGPGVRGGGVAGRFAQHAPSLRAGARGDGILSATAKTTSDVAGDAPLGTVPELERDGEGAVTVVVAHGPLGVWQGLGRLPGVELRGW